MKTTRRGFLLSSLAACAACAPLARVDQTRAKKRARREDAWRPRLSENLRDVEPATLRWLRQIGCEHVIFQGTDRVDRDRKGFWTPADVAPAKKNCDDAGMILESMMIPIDFYRQARLGQTGRDEEIDNVCRTIKAIWNISRSADTKDGWCLRGTRSVPASSSGRSLSPTSSPVTGWRRRRFSGRCWP